KLENENVELEFTVLNYAKENADLKTTYKNLFDSISMIRTQTNTIIDSLQTKLHDTIYENAKLRAQLFDKVSKQKDTTRGTSANTKFAKQSILGKPPSFSRPKLYAVTPLPKSMVFPKIGERRALSKSATLSSVSTPTESKVMKNDNVISPRIFRTNPSKTSRVDNIVHNKPVKAIVRTKPITVSQPHVITKNDVNSKTNGFSPKDVKSTTKTRRPLPRNNPMNDKEPISKRFPNSTFSMTGGQNWFATLLIPLLSEYKPKDKEDHGDNELVPTGRYVVSTRRVVVPIGRVVVHTGRTFRVILFSIHSDEWKSFQSQHQTALRVLFMASGGSDQTRKDEQATTTIANPNDLNISVPDQELEELTLHTSDKLWEIIGIGDVYGLMDNKGRHNFIQSNAGERMRLQAMVTGRSYQGVGGSPEEATCEWMLDS
nr:hypothetical protein [Tanacetum cinerariifolium]